MKDSAPIANRQPSQAWRLFISIELPREVRHKINQHIDALRRELPDARASWTREENLHLTLKFFGDTAVERVEAVSAALKASADQIPPFEMELGGCGVFPSRGKPSVLWIGINDSSNKLQKLHASLETECARAGFPRDQRPFHPHLTIARIRHPKHARDLAELHHSASCDSQMILVSDICLVRSELSSQGSRYTILTRHELTRSRD
jgi:RNA 2',3'-cyclic 3'-phosphodiesterase